MISTAFRAQVELLLRILPTIAGEEVFALKGGTAINLFVRDMPRLSVDIDLTYLPFEPRAAALQGIGEGLQRIKERNDETLRGASTQVIAQAGGPEARLLCRQGQATVKVEVNTVMRGHLWPVRQLQLVQRTQDEFGMFAAAKVVSEAELYGGKICAALDRQHPRDLFDVEQLFQVEGLTDEIRLGFVTCLLSHTRPMHELLRPRLLDQRSAFETQFAGMAMKSYSYEEFEQTRNRLATEIQEVLTETDRKLLLSVKRGEPDWGLFPIEGLENLPAVQWKHENVRRLMQNPRKHAEQLRALEKALSREQG